MDKLNLHKRIILVIDDEVLNLQLLDELLSDAGYTVVTMSNSAEAVDKVSQVNPDLILLDVMMPKMNGYTVCTLIRADRSIPYIPIIFLTAAEYQ